MFVLALVHTFPFIIYHINKGDMVMQWKTSLAYWTGIGAIIPQTYLTIMSLPSIRNRFYEFFKASHMIAAVLFIVFFFFHCDFILSSWDYFLASGVIYFLCLIFSQTGSSGLEYGGGQLQSSGTCLIEDIGSEWSSTGLQLWVSFCWE